MYQQLNRTKGRPRELKAVREVKGQLPQARTLERLSGSKIGERMPEWLEYVLSMIIEEGKLNVDEIFNLTEEERKRVATVLTCGYLTLGGEDRQKLTENVELVLSKESRNEIWERNHYCVLNQIHWQTIQSGQIPTIKDIAEQTGLSRVTVTKHLKEYYDSDTYKEKELAMKFLREKLLTKIYSFAYDGNMRAAKIFMDCTSVDTQQVKNQQNNFIQINGVTITAEQLKTLPKEKQIQVKEIIRLVKR